MKSRNKFVFLIGCLCLQLAVDQSAWARHGGWRGGGWGGGQRYGGGFYGGRLGFGLGFGFGPGFYSPSFFWPNYYWPAYAPYDYYPPIVAPPRKPPVYVERSTLEGKGAAPGETNWRYCASTEGYFPHVKECAEGWQTVSAQPEGQNFGYWYYCAEPAGYYPYVRQCAKPWQQLVP